MQWVVGLGRGGDHDHGASVQALYNQFVHRSEVAVTWLKFISRGLLARYSTDSRSTCHLFRSVCTPLGWILQCSAELSFCATCVG